MNHRKELLAAFDDAWGHEWESMESVFKNLTDDEANYQHEAYRDAEHYLSDPLPGTILWHVHHLAHCYQHYAEAIERRPDKVEAPPAPMILPIEKMLDLLKLNRSRLREVVAALTSDTLDERLANGRSVADFVRAVIRHDAWHSGQVVVVRRLYRAKNRKRTISSNLQE